MKVNKLTALKIILSSLALAGVGVGTWFVASAIVNNFNNVNTGEPLQPGNKRIISLEKSQDVPVKLIEHESNGFFFFGVEGLELINKRIKSDLQFGPEIEFIKSIRINNLNILSRNVSGQYNPFTQEMEISISHLISEFGNIPIDEKVELVFPTIFHEYGHHFANTYITSIATNDSRNSKKLYSRFGNRSLHKNIPKQFLNEFEKALHYNDTVANNLLSNNIHDISSKKTARSFYNESNSSRIKLNSEGLDFLEIDNFNMATEIPFKNKKILFPINSSRYTYLFSIDELLTRKLQQITYIDRLNGSSIANNSTTFTGTEFKNGFSPSTMGTDISRNKKIEWQNGSSYTISEKLELMDYPYGGVFTDINNVKRTIESTAEALWNAYYEVGGYEYGISQISLRNSSTQIDAYTRTALSMSNEDFQNIKFTGFLNKSKNYKGLLLKDLNGSYKNYKFLKNNYEYKLLSAKSSILSNERDLKKAQNKFGYSTDYINVSKIDLKEPIKVWNDINNNDKVEVLEGESLTISPNRPTSTFRESFVRSFEGDVNEVDSDIKNKNFYEVINNSNEAFLQLYNVDNKDLPLPFMSSMQMAGASDKINIPIADDVIMFNDWNDKKKK